MGEPSVPQDAVEEPVIASNAETASVSVVSQGSAYSAATIEQKRAATAAAIAAVANAAPGQRERIVSEAVAAASANAGNAAEPKCVPFTAVLRVGATHTVRTKWLFTCET